MVPTTVPAGVDPPPVDTSARDAEIARWLAEPLRGHDNRAAAMRRVTITASAGAYEIRVENQFGFRCALEFDPAGSPSAMLACRTREPHFSAAPERIAVTCEQRTDEVRCEAPYELRTTDGYSSRERFVFSRAGSGRRPAPPTPGRSDGVIDPWAP